jgi:hypothetical protein
MFDLALCPELGGRVALYDIDIDAARLNEQLGTWLQDQPGVVSHWKYATVSNLPADVVVEINASFRRDEVIPLSAGALPPGLATFIGRHSANQEIIVEAARTRSVELAFQAVYNDPAHHLAIDAAWEMYVRMLQASRDYLPGWKIPELSN